MPGLSLRMLGSLGAGVVRLARPLDDPEAVMECLPDVAEAGAGRQVAADAARRVSSPCRGPP